MQGKSDRPGSDPADTEKTGAAIGRSAGRENLDMFENGVMKNRDNHRPAASKPDSREKERSDADELLDRGLRDTFPASDPPAVTQPTVTGEPGEFARKNRRKS